MLGFAVYWNVSVKPNLQNTFQNVNCTFSDLDKLLAVLHMADSIVSNVTGGTSKVGFWIDNHARQEIRGKNLFR